MRPTGTEFVITLRVINRAKKNMDTEKIREVSGTKREVFNIRRSGSEN